MADDGPRWPEQPSGPTETGPGVAALHRADVFVDCAPCSVRIERPVPRFRLVRVRGFLQPAGPFTAHADESTHPYPALMEPVQAGLRRILAIFVWQPYSPVMADSGSSGFTQARHALLIGNSRYEDPQLRQLTSPDADVRVLATVLEDPEIGGFNVATIVNESWSRAQVQIARFCMDRAREDVILIYYSGHAFRDEYGKLYFAFRDTESDIVTATGIGGTFLIGQLARCRSKHKILILDSAFSGSILQGATEFSGDLVILAASGPTDYSFEDAGGQESLFTHYVVEGLRTGEADLDGDGNVTFDELLTYAKGQVERKNGRQRPRLFSFAERPIVAAKAARHIFISYSRADKDFATAIRDELIVAGHKAWMDEKGIAGGDDWRIRNAT
jgi:Caspase domain/TIR domain